MPSRALPGERRSTLLRLLRMTMLLGRRLGSLLGFLWFASSLSGCDEFTSAPIQDSNLGGQGGAPQSNAPKTCDDLVCGARQECVELGGPRCACAEGYERVDGECVDVDECAKDKHDCPENTECVNTEGSYECKCTKGFFHDGTTCQPRLRLVSVAPDGAPGNGYSLAGGISSDGRYVAFLSGASNLVPGDSNDADDIFVRDMQEGKTTRVSVSSLGEQAAGWSFGCSISADGRYVAFASEAENLVPNDTNGVSDIFLHDTHTKKTERVSVSPTGEEANGESTDVQISADGRHIVFVTSATNLAPFSGTAPNQVVYRNLETGVTELISATAAGVPANAPASHPSISGDGSLIVFATNATNLFDSDGTIKVGLRDRSSGASVAPLGIHRDGYGNKTWLSADGRFLTFSSYLEISGDTGSHEAIFRYSIAEKNIEPVSLTALGTKANSGSSEARISADGSVIVFESWATNLVAGDTNETTDVFVTSPGRHPTRRISVGSLGEQANNSSFRARLSGDGRFVAFTSTATTFGFDGYHVQLYLRLIDWEEE